MCVCVCVLSACAESAVISGLSGLDQQLRGRRAAVTVEAISTFSTWMETERETVEEEEKV